MSGSQDNQVRRIELILEQLETLPTLNTVAVKLLELTTSDDSDIREVIDLVSSDPALSSKVLKLCRSHARGRASDVMSIDRAVVLLGFDALRNAVLSVQVFELFQGMESSDNKQNEQSWLFDRRLLWQHTLATAVLCQRLAKLPEVRKIVSDGQAFICGLLHDLGVLSLHVLMPKSFDRVCEFAEAHAISLDRAADRLIGIDTKTVGKRLTQHWRLPTPLIDAIWLHGQSTEALPDVPHRALIQLVSLADAAARQCYVTPIGHGVGAQELTELCNEIGVNPAKLEELMLQLPSDVEQRTQAMGLEAQPTIEMLLQCLGRANAVLGRTAHQLRRQSSSVPQSHPALSSLARFHDRVSNATTLTSIFSEVVVSAAELMGGRTFVVKYQPNGGGSRQVMEFTEQGRLVQCRIIAVDESAEIPAMDHPQQVELDGGDEIQATLYHDGQAVISDDSTALEALRGAWGAAVRAASRQAVSERLAEQLAHANRTLGEAQDELLRTRAKAAIGEVAAGVAHEMNNPLTVISGRAQVMASRLTDNDCRVMAEQIIDQSHLLSDMITALRRLAEPVKIIRTSVNLSRMISSVIQTINSRSPSNPCIELVMSSALPDVSVDKEKLITALEMIVRNATESEGSSHITVRVQIDDTNDRLKIQVTDNGSGLTDHVLAHAFDPFFSAKRAGRQPGLGLSQARQLIEAHGGRITLENRSSGGAVATIWINEWRTPEFQCRDVA